MAQLSASLLTVSVAWATSRCPSHPCLLLFPSHTLFNWQSLIVKFWPETKKPKTLLHQKTSIYILRVGHSSSNLKRSGRYNLALSLLIPYPFFFRWFPVLYRSTINSSHDFWAHTLAPLRIQKACLSLYDREVLKLLPHLIIFIVTCLIFLCAPAPWVSVCVST